ncbi:hypothetical protein Ddye_005770 [Dipteronia dyeriana]|uniref:Sucrose transporter n=1 Tax=Dipteronia dyeriana TaxID=168575 RepID=A0AAD9XHA7_9ROSI|nr:hypothetical protein Ddye_005770 [Dipteronia dyeriana]
MSVSSIAASVQFTWALQISLLTPYIQTLGVPESFSALIWIYGAFSDMVLQPILGYKSDHHTSRFGYRLPFIIFGTAFTCLSFILIGFTKDIGYLTGDFMDQRLKPRAVVIFVLGFLLMDIVNNTLQGSCRALLNDLCFLDRRAMRTAMSWFSFFMAVVSKVQLSNELTREQFNNNNEAMLFVKQVVSVFHNMKKPMQLLLVVTFLTWLAWFSIILMGTDWVGKEVFGGKVQGDKSS